MGCTIVIRRKTCTVLDYNCKNKVLFNIWKEILKKDMEKNLIKKSFPSREIFLNFFKGNFPATEIFYYLLIISYTSHLKRNMEKICQQL